MARLLILRHGKTELISNTGRDFDRKLVERGKRNCIDMARYIRGHMSIPEIILVSPALRTMETAEWVMKEWQNNPEQIVDERIYNASSDILFDVIHDHAGETATAMIIGHNPGMILLCHDLIADDGNQAGKDINDFPTATLADMVFDLDRFKNLEMESGKLLSLIRPRDMVKVDNKGRLN